MKPYRCRTCGSNRHFVEKDGHRRCSSCRPKQMQSIKDAYYEKNRLKIRRAKKLQYKRREGFHASYKSKSKGAFINGLDRHVEKRRLKIDGGTLTVEEVIAIVERDDGRCVYCGVEVDVKIKPKRLRGFDHLLHLLGDDGEHAAWNIAVCCGTCNADKGCLPLFEYIEERGLDFGRFRVMDDRAWGLKTAFI